MQLKDYLKSLKIKVRLQGNTRIHAAGSVRIRTPRSAVFQSKNRHGQSDSYETCQSEPPAVKHG